MTILLFPIVLDACEDLESVIVPDYTLDQIKDNINSLLNSSNVSDSDYNNNNSVDEADTPEHLVSSLTRMTTKLQDDNLSENDIVNVLLELAKLEVTVPALLETGAGKVVRKLEKKMEGKVAKLAREIVIRWKRIATKYKSPVQVVVPTVGQKMTDNTETVLESGGQRLDPVRGCVDCEVERGVSMRGDLVDVRHWGQGGDQLEVAGQTRAVEDGVVVGQNGLVDVDVLFLGRKLINQN